MNKRKALTLLLSLAILLSLALPAATARADDDGIGEDNGDINEVGTEIDGLKLDKTAVYNEKTGHYTITLEAYATGASTFITQDIPTDFILVLDQSGSMDRDIGQVQYTAYTGNNTQNSRNYEKRHNGGSANLWHKLPDGSFVSVSVTLQQTITPNKITKGRNDNGSSGYTNYWENRNRLYTYVNGEIKKVIYTRERDWFGENWNCKYALEDGTILNQNNEGSRYSPTFQNTDDGYLYLGVLNENQNVYTYTYTDSAGTVQAIGTSTGANTKFEPAFYQRSISTSGGGSRLDALKNAATTFANAVAAKAAGADGDINTTGDNIDHRIAVVGFASQSGNGNNTELLSIAGKNSGSVGVAYNSITNQNLKDVLQSMDTQNGRDMVNAAVTALAASGATRTDLGMDMAQRILNANPVSEGETRNRIVIVFTDGSPTDSNGFELNVANAAINNANAIKDSGATVYSIGIFSGADASSAGKEPDEDYYDDPFFGSNYTEAEMSAACNWFMQQVSSNNGTPQSPSYYLSASDAGTLNSIFHQISQQIQTGGSNTELSGTAVVKDIISPYFTLPAGTTANDIQIDTYDCTGKTGDTYTWSSTSGGSGGATATVNGDQVSVTGFDFAKNWCGTETDTNGNTTVRGKKLVISFTVDPKSGFLGGNDVPTNNTSAGIYKEGETTPSKTFPLPLVNVPIKDIAVTAENKNVYLLGGVTLDDLKKGATVTVGDDIKLDLSKANDAEKPYGLEPWQTAYVNIIVEYKDGDKVLTELTDLKDDVTYTVEVAVAPKTTDPTSTQGETAVDKTGSATGHVNVFKPVLTYKDSEAYYGESVPANNDYSGNKVGSETWKHGNTASTDEGVTMLGAKPTLDISYTPDESKLKDGKYTKQDVPVAATVKIGSEDVTVQTNFVHQDCTTACGWEAPATPGAPAFLLHVKTCTLKITKQGGAANESYVFDVYKDGIKYSEVAIWGNSSQVIYELPVGTYSITEDTGWSWRYKAPAYANNGVELSALNPTGTITCTNTKGNDQWLNDYDVISNIYGKSNTPATDGNN